MNRALALLLIFPLAGCLQRPEAAPAVHYVVGSPYQAGGVWRYPEASFSYDETGVAAVYPERMPRFTADGERYSADAFAAAHPTLQLPAIARITNLENGRRIVVRVNDRGPADPARILAVTPRVAHLLGFPADGLARVRVRVLPAASEALALSLPGGPQLAIAAAPVGKVSMSELSLLPGSVAAPGAARQKANAPPARAVPVGEAPGRLSTVPPASHALFVRTGIFTGQDYAALQAAALARFGATEVPRYGSGTLRIEVRIGPIASISEADAVLEQVIAAGVAGARLVVE
ncbi:MAG: septal ring lytic transglycosylase RlpA family protein [Acetobacteraceae bacterium]